MSEVPESRQCRIGSVDTEATVSPPSRPQRRELDPAGPAPNVFIVGAAKAGTTSIHAYLARHPEAFMSHIKEPHYFATFELSPKFDNFMPVIRDAATYQDLFRGSEGFKVVGEASPSYLCDPMAANLIRQSVPGARIVVSLRNPVERAHSHYLMEYRQGRETRPFAEAIDADDSRRTKGWGVSFQYLDLGLYAEQVGRYMEVFGREKVHVVLFEELIDKTAHVMKQVAEFLQIDPFGFPASAFERAHNPFEESRGEFARLVLRNKAIRIWSKRLVPQALRTKVRNRFLFASGRKPIMDPAMRRRLTAYFAADIDRLEILLNRDLSLLRGIR